MKFLQNANRDWFILQWSQWLKLAIMLGLCMSEIACATTVMLESVVKVRENRLASPGEMQGIQIYRMGTRIAPRLNMSLEMGDEIITDPESTVVMRYTNGSIVYLRPDTHIRIGSLVDIWGELFVKVRGAFQVETEFVAAGAEGTGFLVNVEPHEQVSVIVLDGVIRLASKTGRWYAVSVEKYQKAVIRGQELPERMRASADELTALSQWVNQVDRLTVEAELRRPRIELQYPIDIFRFPKIPTPKTMPRGGYSGGLDSPG